VNSNAKWIVAALLTCTVAVGCNSNKKKEGAMAMQPSSLDVPAAPVASTAPPTYTPPQPAIADAPPAQQPVIEQVADASDTSAPAASYSTPKARKASYKSSSASSGTKYTVKKGESLWTIAQSHYGNGNKWKLIANANPSINPNKIQAGQTIVLP
jgi:5'-nucleotidase